MIGLNNMTKSKKQKTKNKIIAKKRIEKLFLLAEKSAEEKNLYFSNRYVTLARKISMKYLVPIPNIYKKRFCKHCYSYLVPSVNSTFRLNKGKITIFCKNCKKYTRLPLKNKEK